MVRECSRSKIFIYGILSLNDSLILFRRRRMFMALIFPSLGNACMCETRTAGFVLLRHVFLLHKCVDWKRPKRKSDSTILNGNSVSILFLARATQSGKAINWKKEEKKPITTNWRSQSNSRTRYIISFLIWSFDLHFKRWRTSTITVSERMWCAERLYNVTLFARTYTVHTPIVLCMHT